MKLHGFPISNYYNMVKLALLEKGIEFEEVVTSPRREPDFLAISPAGKIPVLECDQGYLAETRAILSYLEAKFPEPALMPADAFEQGRAEQIFSIINSYVDTAVRPLFGTAYFGKPLEEGALEKMNEELAFAISALGRVASFNPFIAGKALSLADLPAIFTLPLAQNTAKILEQPSDFALEGYEEYIKMMRARPHVQKVQAESAKALASMR